MRDWGYTIVEIILKMTLIKYDVQLRVKHIMCNGNWESKFFRKTERKSNM